jgi:hypothetical protein
MTLNRVGLIIIRADELSLLSEVSKQILQLKASGAVITLSNYWVNSKKSEFLNVNIEPIEDQTT